MGYLISDNKLTICVVAKCFKYMKLSSKRGDRKSQAVQVSIISETQKPSDKWYLLWQK
jgi:hypothetical protein